MGNQKGGQTRGAELGTSKGCILKIPLCLRRTEQQEHWRRGGRDHG